jgi:hypothetical protein
MNARLLLGLVTLVLSIHTLANEATHRELALRMTELNIPESSLNDLVEPRIREMIKRMKEKGLPDPAIAEAQQALAEWLSTGIPWKEIREEVTALYEREFSETELRDLHAFYQTPTGQKVLIENCFPALQRRMVEIGRKYEGTK